MARFQRGAADRKIFYRALGLGAIQGRRGYAYFAHSVVFDTEFRSIFGHTPMLPYRFAAKPRGSWHLAEGSWHLAEGSWHLAEGLGAPDRAGERQRPIRRGARTWAEAELEHWANWAGRLRARWARVGRAFRRSPQSRRAGAGRPRLPGWVPHPHRAGLPRRPPE